MALIDPEKKELCCKIVYYGPGRSGKTTNLLYLYNALPPKCRRKLLSLDNKEERTLFFDLLPLNLTTINGLDIRLNLYTVPGESFYKYTRRIILKGIDGLVFVADSLRVRREKNKESLEDLKQNLLEWNIDLQEIPLVFQYNKKDLEKMGVPILSIEELQQDLNQELQAPHFEAIAPKGIGVFETLKTIGKLSIKYVAQKHFSGEKIELEVEKALDEIFQQAKKVELKEEGRIYSLPEHISEEKDLKKDWEELIGILTLSWEGVPEINEKILEKCQKLKKKSLDNTNQELITLLENCLNKVKIFDNLSPEEITYLKQLEKIIYDYNFEGKNIEKDLEELKKKAKEQNKVETILVEDILADKNIKQEKKGKTEIDFLVKQLVKDYQRLVGIEEFLKRNKKQAIKKLIIKGKNEIENALLNLDETYKIRLTEIEKEIREFIRKKEEVRKAEKIEIKVKEGLLCKTMHKTILIPIDEVAFAGDIKDWWRTYLHQGEFPLKLLKGKGLFNQIFGKIKSKIQGELKEKDERELQKLTIKTNKLLDTEKRLVILWKDEKGLVLLTEDCELISLDTNIAWEPQKEPFIGKALIEGEEVFLFSITKWKNKSK